MDTKVLKPGEIFTLGKRDFIKGEILFSQGDLKDFEYKDTIFIKDRVSQKTKILSSGFFRNSYFKKNGRFRFFDFVSKRNENSTS